MAIKPKLNLFDTSMAVVSLVIGIGIFRTPSIVAQNTGKTAYFFAAWIIGGVIAMLGALIFAEIGSRKPLAGGFYKIVSEVYHPALAFMLNWLYIFLNSASFAAVALIGTEYFVSLLPYHFASTENEIRIIASGITIILFTINYIGIKMGAVATNILTIIKITMILLFSILAVIFTGGASTPNLLINSNINANPTFWAVGAGMISVFYTFGGYQMSMNLCSDIQRPKRNIPIGIISGMTIVTILYLLINYGYYNVLGINGIASSPLIAADMANSIWGETGKRIITAVIFISVLGFMNATLIQLPRAFYAMAEDKVLPPIFHKINEKTQVQGFTLIFITVCSMLFIILQGRFDKIVNMVMFNDTIIMATLASTIFAMRYKEKKYKLEINTENYKIPFYPIIPIIFILFLLVVTVNAYLKDSISGIVSILIFFAGYPIYKGLRKLGVRN